MIISTAENLQQAWSDLVFKVNASGKKVSPRGFDSVELENVLVEYPQPSSYIFKNPLRCINPVFHLVELFYFLNGRSDDTLSHYISNMLEFSNEETGRFDGSYGPSIYESLPNLFVQLSSDSNSRRAVIPIMKYHHLVYESKDIPCNVVLGFRIRDGRLNMNVVTRSQDLYRGFIYDTLEFQLLQFMIAQMFRLEVGVYSHNIFSLHLYESDMKKAVNAAELWRSGHGLEENYQKPRFIFSSFREFWAYCRRQDIIAQLAVIDSDSACKLAGLDDLSLAIPAWKMRSSVVPVGIYTEWVNWWLENHAKNKQLEKTHQETRQQEAK